MIASSERMEIDNVAALLAILDLMLGQRGCSILLRRHAAAPSNLYRFGRLHCPQRGFWTSADSNGGSFGSIIGRNSFQRPKEAALRMFGAVMDIHAKAPAGSQTQ
jgi:hypothetical protein